MKKLPKSFYNRNDVIQVARELLGMVLVTNIDGWLTSGRIVETEAYVGLVDKASHSFGGRRTPRNEHMYAAAGTAYIYICYGMHQMMNVVTNKAGIPDAVLIRAIDPIAGIETMLERSGKEIAGYDLTKGPGNVGKALGLNKCHSGSSLLGDLITICRDSDSKIPGTAIGISKRIGVESAGNAAELPYRFYIKGNRYVSGRPVK